MENQPSKTNMIFMIIFCAILGAYQSFKKYKNGKNNKGTWV